MSTVEKERVDLSMSTIVGVKLLGQRSEKQENLFFFLMMFFYAILRIICHFGLLPYSLSLSFSKLQSSYVDG